MFRQGSTNLKLPVNPTDISIGNSAKNDSFRVEGLGEVTIIQSPDPITLDFDFELPAIYYSACSYYPIDTPKNYYDTLDSMKKKGPVQVIITEKNFSLLMSIEDLSYTESGGDIGTYNVKIKLKEYIETKARQVSISYKKVYFPPSKPARPSSPTPKNRTHTVVSGDTLWGIAVKYLGNGSRYPEIHKLNSDKISNPNLIYPGQVLQIPNK